jgi:hypothetical protein
MRLPKLLRPSVKSARASLSNLNHPPEDLVQKVGRKANLQCYLMVLALIYLRS